MNKWLLFITLLFFPLTTQALTLNKCIDGDTAKFNDNNTIITVRFLAIDTPELNTDNQYADIARNFTCHQLQIAQNIELVKDGNSTDTDKYGRKLRWVFVDNKLLQKELIKNGYAKVAYLYGDYQYIPELKDLEQQAIKNQVGMWHQPDYDYYYVILTITLILLMLLKKIRKHS